MEVTRRSFFNVVAGEVAAAAALGAYQKPEINITIK